jgi:hypothetical protein
MAIKRGNFEKAVNTLLSPHNYEYMLFIQSQLKKNPHHLLSHKSARGQDVIKMVQSETPSAMLSSPDDALRVLREAVRRLK